MTLMPIESLAHSPDETEIVVALRDLFSAYPGAMSCGLDTMAGLLWALGYASRRPSEFEAAVALEALTLEGEIAA